MPKEGKDRSQDHRSADRSGSDRVATSTSRRDREGSSSSNSSTRDRDRDSNSAKRLRNEGETRGTSTISTSSAKSDAGPSTSKVSTVGGAKSSTSSVSVAAAASSTTSAVSSSSARSLDDPHHAVTPNKKELYESVVEYENNEAKLLNVAESVTQCQDLCKELEQNFHEIMALKNLSAENADEIEEAMEDGLMKIMSLRRLNRTMKLKLKSVKEDQLVMRSEVDSDHLLLQNLLYEATHLQNQVAAVQDYKGMDEKIDLIPVTQFYSEAPEKISKPEVTKTDPHLLRIGRLEYEFIQRQKLTEDCNALEKEKELTAKSIEDKQTKIDSTLPLLNTVLEATKPVQDFFGIDISAKKVQAQSSQYLPPELYILFVQSNAFKEAGGGKDDFIVNLCGNLEAAKELVVTPDEIEVDSDSDKEQDPDVEVSSRRLLRKKSSVYLTPEDNRKKLLQKHPMWVEWIVQAKGGSDSVLIQFFYLVKLQIVTVKAKILADSKKSAEGEIGTSDSLLIDLFPEDTGEESPNPANVFIFQKVDARGIANFVTETGRPFMWAQRLAGVEFPTNPKTLQDAERVDITFQPKMHISADNIGKILKSTRKRLTSQTTLWQQLKLLESRNLQIPSEAKDLFPPKASTTFKSWESISFAQYSACGFTKDHLKTETVSEKHRFYKALLERGRATITAQVALSLDFPSTPPVFCVQLELDGDRRNSQNDPAIRDIEKEVNVYCIPEFEQWSEIFVSLQLVRLIQCIDIVLETDFILGESAGPSEFGREKLFLRAATGRNLRRPFKYFGTGGGYFSQRF